jgi:hypothetical protein
MAEIGMSMEPPKKGMVEGLRRAFTLKGAKEKWYQDHKDVVLKYTDVHNGLNDEQRATVMAQIESDATKSAKIAVGKHVGALAVTVGTLGFAGGLVGSEKFRTFVGKGGKIGEWLAGKGATGALGLEVAKGKVMEKGAEALNFVKHTIPDKARELWTRIRPVKVTAV